MMKSMDLATILRDFQPEKGLTQDQLKELRDALNIASTRVSIALRTQGRVPHISHPTAGK